MTGVGIVYRDLGDRHVAVGAPCQTQVSDQAIPTPILPDLQPFLLPVAGWMGERWLVGSLSPLVSSQAKLSISLSQLTYRCASSSCPTSWRTRQCSSVSAPTRCVGAVSELRVEGRRSRGLSRVVEASRGVRVCVVKPGSAGRQAGRPRARARRRR